MDGTHWDRSATQYPSAQETGLSLGQVTIVGQLITDPRHDPSGHLTGLATGQWGGLVQLSFDTTQRPSEHKMGVAASQLVCVGQDAFIEIQLPEGQVKKPTGQPNAIEHSLTVVTQEPSGHKIGKLEGQEV